MHRRNRRSIKSVVTWAAVWRHSTGYGSKCLIKCLKKLNDDTICWNFFSSETCVRRSVDKSFAFHISSTTKIILILEVGLGKLLVALARRVVVGFKSLGTHDHILLSHDWLTAKLLLVPAITVTLGSKSHGTHDHIYSLMTLWAFRLLHSLTEFLPALFINVIYT
jgi:hypothetical protein